MVKSFTSWYASYCCSSSDYKYSKTPSTHVLLQILASIGRYEPSRMIVMIVVTKNDVYNVPGISDRLLGYYPHSIFSSYDCKHARSETERTAGYTTRTYACTGNSRHSSLLESNTHLSRFTVLPVSPMAVRGRRMAGPGLRPSLLETHYCVDKFQVIMSCQCMSTYVQSVMVPALSHYVPTSRTY